MEKGVGYTNSMPISNFYSILNVWKERMHEEYKTNMCEKHMIYYYNTK
jgi:hypothetical protein